ncbi:hypothetical protein AWENTII_002202 [Aspergillus wentii]
MKAIPYWMSRLCLLPAKSLDATVGKSRLRRQARTKRLQREHLLVSITTLYRKVKQIPCPTLSDDDISKLELEIKELDLTDGGQTTWLPFFQPFSREDLQKYPISEDEVTQSWLGAQRPDLPGGLGGTLASFNKWRYREGFEPWMFKPFYWNMIFSERNPRFCPESSWEARGKDTAPHLVFTLKTELVNEEKLLRSEVLAILVAIETRLTSEIFKDHLIIPIMIISFMGQHGRIIQAYHDGNNLALRKSKLFEFFNAETSPIDLFSRFTISKRVGNTGELPEIVKKEQS